MATANTAPASDAEHSQTDELDSTPSTPTLAPTQEEHMAHNRSDAGHMHVSDRPESDLPLLPTEEDTLAPHAADEEAHNVESVFDDGEMHRQLMDIESSFIPEPAPQPEAVQGPPGVDDTYLFGGSPGNSQRSSQNGNNDSALQRVMDTLEEMTKPKKKPKKLEQDDGDVRRPTSSASTVKAPDFSLVEEGSSLTNENVTSADSIAMPPPSAPANNQKNKRPSFLQHRGSSQRSSVSSFTNRSDASGDNASTESLGADYSLQTGGAIPRSSGPARMSLGLSRLPSLGSIASSMSGYSDSNPWDKGRSISANSLNALLHQDNSLGRLDEEVPNSATPPETPRAPSVQPAAPTDTVITRHVQDIQVPDSIARDFRAKHSRSPDKRHNANPFTRSKHNLTLKEQNSKIDKLSKENFDLKLKIHFLDQALQNRSDEGVKEMISKNVQLQTDLATEKKESQSMRKKIRDLERRLKAQEEGQAKPPKEPGSGSEDEGDEQSSRQAELEEEIEFLRERLETTEITVDQWQQEALQKEADNRRMADYIKTMREKSPGGGESGYDEAVTMWKEDFEDERARREQVETRCQQAESEAEKLREEVQRLRDQNQQMQQQNSTTNKVLNSTRRMQQSFTSHSNADSDGNDLAGTASMGGTSGTLVEHLQSDNDKLQRDLHAQASMLTSRNRENLRLREENEGLKLAIRRGDNSSTAGDSILERSISRNHMRSVSRASGGTRLTQASDPDDYETKNAALRDELSQLKLSYKELDDQLNGHLDMLETTENKVKELEREIEAQTEDLQALANERDEALELLQDKEQECEELRQEALDTVQRLEVDLDQKQTERDRLYNDLENTTEDFHALQQEMKNVSESLLQLEDDRDASLRKIQNLEAELSDANEELNRQDKLLSEERSKNERLDVQLESCQGEIDFLREEQEGDKIKIGELESALNHTQATLQEARERARDLEERMTEERQQRDALETQEKQENLSSKEVEASTWKQRHDEFELALRETLGNPNGTRASLFKDIAKLQRDLQGAMQDLDTVRADLTEKDRLLRNRDTLLENTGMESRRLSEMLERERQARRQDLSAWENAKRGHQSTVRAIQQAESRVLELETLRSQDRQRIHHLEKNYKEQLLERNNLLYALWNRLSTLCGTEWSRNNALINGELTSMELISKNVNGFNKNIIFAVRTVEGIIGSFKQRIRQIEKDLVRDYQTLEHSLDVRVKRLDQLEKLVLAQRQSIGRPSTVRGGFVEMNNAELTKLRSENKTLRSEVQTLRAITTTTQAGNDVIVSRSSSRAGSPNSSKRASMAQTLLRAHSASVVEHLSTSTPGHPYPAAGPLQTSEQKWIHRLKELERRLKAEREARLLDRSGARKRLEQKVEENAELRSALEKERDLRTEDEIAGSHGSGSGSGSRTGSGRASAIPSLKRPNGKEREEEMY
ncbi:Microtub-assoc multi-domain protein [Pyrenophora tritici-repentis]|uniref:Microtub-assoc multi-domain protein n=1 Tax=Pyrenophora tritici-repentis TaxID=45151 RepID=A0A317APC2_9PLEO|nr:Microtub-assoc multi-domain protein [Pyrenophora tritici-repentis]